MQCHAMPCNAMLCYAMVWYGMVMYVCVYLCMCVRASVCMRFIKIHPDVIQLDLIHSMFFHLSDKCYKSMGRSISTIFGGNSSTILVD